MNSRRRRRTPLADHVKLVGLAAIVATLSACGPKPVNLGEQDSPAAAAEREGAPAQSSGTTDSNEVAASQVSLRVSDSAGLDELLARGRGSVVLVDFWATWCGPCIEQFPHTVDLANRLRERGLVVIAVSMDNPTSEPQVRAFLEKQQAPFENLLSGYRSPVEATKAFNLPGPVPCYRVYDRKGNLHRQFSVDPRATKQFTTADIDAAVEELLTEG